MAVNSRIMAGLNLFDAGILAEHNQDGTQEDIRAASKRKNNYEQPSYSSLISFYLINYILLIALIAFPTILITSLWG